MNHWAYYEYCAISYLYQIKKKGLQFIVSEGQLHNLQADMQTYESSKLHFVSEVHKWPKSWPKFVNY